MQENRERVLKEREAEQQRALEEQRKRLEMLQRVKVRSSMAGECLKPATYSLHFVTSGG
jgi:hypothetical protein